IAIPNAKLANEPIDNISARRKIWYHPIIRLRNDTTHAQVQQVLEGIRNLLDQDEQVLHEGARVRFRDFGEHALKIEVYAYIDTTDWAQFLECAERLNLSILEVIAAAGTRLALPTQAIHLETATT
ncbi:MAG TPA: mechanosensitive ion channel family protein, partial [Chromatiales bacterium]|nr:mechanosensitive ion channel family protein [Chromatiales bacterium]